MDVFGSGVPEGGSGDRVWRSVVSGGGRRLALEKRWLLKSAGEVARGLAVEGFVGEEEEEDFEVDVLRDGEPVELLKGWADVVTGAGAGVWE